MKLRVLYFAALREALGCEGETVEPPATVATLGELRVWLARRGGVWAEALAPGRNLRAALGQRLARADTALVDGAEVAFFPPVTGG